MENCLTTPGKKIHWKNIGKNIGKTLEKHWKNIGTNLVSIISNGECVEFRKIVYLCSVHSTNIEFSFNYI